MIDVGSGGDLMDKTPAAEQHLISNMASNMQLFGTRGTITPRMVNEVGMIDNLRLENQLTELTSLVRQLAIGQLQPIATVKTCGICTSVEHPIDMCPTLQETESDHPVSVGSIGGYQYGKQPYANRPFEGQQFGRPPYWPSPNQGPMQLGDSVQIEACLRAKATINSRIQDIKRHRSNSSNISSKQPGVPVKHEHHCSGPQDASKPTSRLCKSVIVSRIREPPLIDNSKSKRECERSITKKW
ncbi:hypothetical protein CR513_49260, partial [Mucuna pruriens]